MTQQANETLKAQAADLREEAKTARVRAVDWRAHADREIATADELDAQAAQLEAGLKA